MKGFDLITPGVDRSMVERESLRVFEICDGCRRCFNLCPSFNTLFDRVDVHESDLSKLESGDYVRIGQECYYCKLCFNHCPYTPPHQYELDFPRLMIAWKQQIAGRRGTSWSHRLMTKTDLLGKTGSLFASLSNWALRTAWVRGILHRVVGLHRDRRVLRYQRERLTRWWQGRPPGSAAVERRGRVVLFASCLVNYQATDVGKAAVQVLEKNGVEVVVPEHRCCGMPSFDIGDTNAIVAAATANLRSLKPWLDAGYEVVSPMPSCSLMLKREYPYLVPGEESARLAERTFDLCEYLMRMKRAGTLATDFVRKPGRVAYQIPCHLRDQNIGFKSKELMEAAGAQVRVVERCSGHDGTWGAKKEFFALSMKIARKAVRELEEAPADLIASDCPLAALQLDQAGMATEPEASRTRHPIQIVRDAYGLPS